MKFLDANFIISLFVEDHKHNKRALEIWKKIKDEDLIISNSIIQEVITVLNVKIKVSKDILKNAYLSLNSEEFLIVDDSELYDETMKGLLTYYPKRLSFFDCLYMEVMEQMGIIEVVTFYDDFDLNENIKRIH